jgi:tripartite-type tricarboxylate transporter receptor subunit TctC
LKRDAGCGDILKTTRTQESLEDRPMMTRRHFLTASAAGGLAFASAPIARAQAYPSRPITMVVPYPPGGLADAVARVLAEPMTGSLGQPIIIENVSGADGSIGTGRVARAKPDGYTIELGSISTHMLNGAFYSLPYDIVNDFAPISPLATLPYVLFGRKTMPVKDLNELIASLKANPNKASAGLASSFLRLVAAFFQRETGTQFTLVPYRGSAPAIQDLVAGQIDMSFDTPVSLPLMRAGSIKAYATTSDARSALAPDIPTFAEMGLPALSFPAWFALFASKGTPREIIDRLNAAAVQALADPAARSRLADLGTEIFPREQQTPKALGAFQKAQIEKWWPLIKEFGIKAE